MRIVTDGGPDADDATLRSKEKELPAPPDLKPSKGPTFASYLSHHLLSAPSSTRARWNVRRAAADIGAPTSRRGCARQFRLFAATRIPRSAGTPEAAPEGGPQHREAVRKARFAQIAARHVDAATSIPKYVAKAARWLMKP